MRRGRGASERVVQASALGWQTPPEARLASGPIAECQVMASRTSGVSISLEMNRATGFMTRANEPICAEAM